MGRPGSSAISTQKRPVRTRRRSRGRRRPPRDCDPLIRPGSRIGSLDSAWQRVASWRRGVDVMRGLKYIAASIALLSAMAVALGQPVGLPRIGWVLNGTPENTSHLVEAIRAGLAVEGLVDGKNVILDVRFTAGRSERYPELFSDLVRQPVNVLAASSHAGISAARDA